MDMNEGMLTSELQEKLNKLEDNIRELGSVVIGFSGGVDSSFLLAVAHNVLGENVIAVTGADQFAFQAPGSAEKIDSFCKLHYDTKFPRFAKIKVNGKDADPLYVYLKEQKPGRIKWNFAKFLIDRKGNVVERFAPSEKPASLETKIEAELSKA